MAFSAAKVGLSEKNTFFLMLKADLGDRKTAACSGDKRNICNKFITEYKTNESFIPKPETDFCFNGK